MRELSLDNGPTGAFIVTGANGAIGFSIVEMLLDHFSIPVVAQHFGFKGRLSDLENKSEGRLVVLESDFRIEGSGEDIFQEAHSRFGLVAGVVNNAGVMDELPDFPSDDFHHRWIDSYRVNVLAPVGLSLSMVKHVSEMNKKGIVVNITSRAAHRGDLAQYMHYSAAKSALQNFTKTLARQYA